MFFFIKGTTWVEEIVWLMKNKLNFERAKSEFHYTRVMFIDRGINPNLLKFTPSPRVFKSHLPIQFLPNKVEQKARVK
jgi:hypothetical protein